MRSTSASSRTSVRFSWMSLSLTDCSAPLTIMSSSSRSSWNSVRMASSSISSVRSFKRVIGVRRSCEIETNRRSRSSRQRLMRSRMPEKARAVLTYSRLPVSGRLGTVSPLPKASAASARAASGRVVQRTTRMVSSRMAASDRPCSTSRSSHSGLSLSRKQGLGISAARQIQRPLSTCIWITSTGAELGLVRRMCCTQLSGRSPTVRPSVDTCRPSGQAKASRASGRKGRSSCRVCAATPMAMPTRRLSPMDLTGTAPELALMKKRVPPISRNCWIISGRQLGGKVMKQRIAAAALWARCWAATRVSASDLLRNCTAQIRPPTSCVTSTPRIITTDSRPSSESGSIQSSSMARRRRRPGRVATGSGAGATGAAVSGGCGTDVGREDIAGAAHGLDQVRLASAVVEAQAQLADLHVQRAVQRAGVASAGFLAEQAAVQHVAGMLDEILQQLVVHAGQRHHLAFAVVQGAFDGIERETGEAVVARGSAAVDTDAAVDGLDARQQLARAVGLGDVVVGAQFQADHTIGLVGAGGEHDDRDVGLAPHRLAQGKAVGVGQHHVQDHQRELIGKTLELGQEGRAVMGQADLVLVLFQIGLEQGAGLLVIVDDQYLARHGGLLHLQNSQSLRLRDRVRAIAASRFCVCSSVMVRSRKKRCTSATMASLVVSSVAMRCTRLGAWKAGPLLKVRQESRAQRSMWGSGVRSTGMEPLILLYSDCTAGDMVICASVSCMAWCAQLPANMARVSVLQRWYSPVPGAGAQPNCWSTTMPQALSSPRAQSPMIIMAASPLTMLRATSVQGRSRTGCGMAAARPRRRFRMCSMRASRKAAGLMSTNRRRQQAGPLSASARFSNSVASCQASALWASGTMPVPFNFSTIWSNSSQVLGGVRLQRLKMAVLQSSELMRWMPSGAATTWP
eukprot:TRINITY_DN325_c0_g12_i1.p1 TRINITY_DN325_c0_g12~~TRINITY_DN325_c0_g12_i1.p1  ORF type:complete len:912 (-),score=299.24 TRINITY_DN325_c0_g12_i1:4616-7351(-)